MLRIKVTCLRAWVLAGVLAVSLAAVAAFPSTARAAEPIKIGFSMTLTGGLAANGKAALVAMEIWRDDINKKGGLLGRPVEFVYYDDSTNPANVPGIYTKLLNVDEVDLVVSSYGTNLIAPAMPIIMKKKLVFMSLFGLAVNDRFNYDRYFQIMPSGPVPKEDWSRGFFQLAMSQSDRPKSIALLATDSEFSKNAVAGARTNATKAGLEIVYDKTFKPGTADFSPIVRAIQATNPDLVYVGCYPPGAAGIVRAANELGLEAKMFGGSMVGLQYAALLTKLGPQLNGMVNYDFWTPEPTLNFSGIEAFLTKYQAKAKEAGTDSLGHYLPPYAYAYLEILGQAVNAVGSLDQGKLAEYIHKTTFDTVVGPVSFAKNGEWAKTRVLMVQFQNLEANNVDQFHKPGKRVVLYPSDVKSGDFIYPYNKAR
jgi:branched-chain amino acid transport system substrate-binding protein